MQSKDRSREISLHAITLIESSDDPNFNLNCGFNVHAHVRRDANIRKFSFEAQTPGLCLAWMQQLCIESKNLELRMSDSGVGYRSVPSSNAASIKDQKRASQRQSFVVSSPAPSLTLSSSADDAPRGVGQDTQLSSDSTFGSPELKGGGEGGGDGGGLVPVDPDSVRRKTMSAFGVRAITPRGGGGGRAGTPRGGGFGRGVDFMKGSSASRRASEGNLTGSLEDKDRSSPRSEAKPAYSRINDIDGDDGNGNGNGNDDDDDAARRLQFEEAEIENIRLSQTPSHSSQDDQTDAADSSSAEVKSRPESVTSASLRRLADELVSQDVDLSQSSKDAEDDRVGTPHAASDDVRVSRQGAGTGWSLSKASPRKQADVSPFKSRPQLSDDQDLPVSDTRVEGGMVRSSGGGSGDEDGEEEEGDAHVPHAHTIGLQEVKKRASASLTAGRGRGRGRGFGRS